MRDSAEADLSGARRFESFGLRTESAWRRFGPVFGPISTPAAVFVTEY